MRPSTKRHLLQASTQDCLADYAKRFSEDEARQLLVEFTRIDEQKTARAWLDGDRMPAGETLLRLRGFLSLVGYRVEELYALPEVTRQLVMLIALQELTTNAVRIELEYRNTQEVYRVLLHGHALMSNRVRKLEQLVRTHRDDLEALVALWRDRIDSALFTNELDSSPLPVAPATAVQMDSLLAQALVESIRTTRALCQAASHPGHQVARMLRQRVNREEVRQLLQALEHLLE